MVWSLHCALFDMLQQARSRMLEMTRADIEAA